MLKQSLVLASLLLSSVAVAEQALSLTEAQHLAVERSRQLVARDTAASANRELAVAAGQLPDPVLKLGIDNLPVEGADQFTIGRDFMTMRRVSLMQEFTRSDKRQLRAQIYQGEAEKSLAEKSISIAAIQRDTALTWVDRYYAEAQAAVLDEQLNVAKLEITAAETAYSTGKGSQADVFAAYGMLAFLRDQLSEANRRIHTAKSNLARWVGEDAGKPLTGRPDFESVQLDTSSMDATMAHHPGIALLAKQEQIAESEARLAEANKQADWSVEVSYAQRGSAFADMLSVGVSVPLQWDQKNRQNRELAAKLAAVEQIRAEREEMLREHSAEISNMVLEWQSGRERLARYRQEILPLAAERTRAATVAYQTGKTSLADLLLVRRAEISTRGQALELEKDTAMLWAKFNFLMPQNEAPHSSHGKDTP